MPGKAGAFRTCGSKAAANISAREVVVLGKVRGNMDASDRVDIRTESSLIGNVTT
jgi:cytoskeletal protein CcmA (bactofilin family)